MSGVNLKFSILSDWRQTLTIAFQQLRRISFITEQTFSFGSFNPQPNFQGMTATAVKVRRAYYLRIWTFLWFSVDIEATLAAPFNNFITVIVPGTAPGVDLNASIQGGGAMVRNAGASEAGLWLVNSTTNLVGFLRTTGANFSAGAAEVVANGFIEVL